MHIKTATINQYCTHFFPRKLEITFQGLEIFQIFSGVTCPTEERAYWQIQSRLLYSNLLSSSIFIETPDCENCRMSWAFNDGFGTSIQEKKSSLLTVRWFKKGSGFFCFLIETERSRRTEQNYGMIELESNSETDYSKKSLVQAE